MGTKSPGAPQRCHYILQHCLAIQLNKPGHVPEDFWMYDSGYMIFQVRNIYNRLISQRLQIVTSFLNEFYDLNSIKLSLGESFFFGK